MSPSIPSSVNITFDNMISEPGNFRPFSATRSSSRMASAPLGKRDAGICVQKFAHALADHASPWRSHSYAILTERYDFVAGAHRIAQADHQKQEREMTALFAAQPFPQCPIDNGQLASTVVIKQVAGVGIAVKDRLLNRREQRHGNQRLDELLRQLSPARERQARGCTRHLDPSLLRERGDGWRA